MNPYGESILKRTDSIIPSFSYIFLSPFFEGVQSLGVTGLVTLLENFFHIEGKKNASVKQMKGTNRDPFSIVHLDVPWPVGTNREG